MKHLILCAIAAAAIAFIAAVALNPKAKRCDDFLNQDMGACDMAKGNLK